MKKILLLAGILMVSQIGFTQQIPHVSHFMYDQLRTNPGSTGSMDMLCVNGIARQQMVGFPGRPDNFFFNFEVPFNLLGGKHGAGLSLYRDVLGFNSDIQASLSYAYRFNVGDGTLGIGINGGLVDKTVDGDWVYPETSQDEMVPSGDADMTLNLGAGIFYRTEEIFFGVSVLNLTSPEVVTPPTEGGVAESKYNLKRHYYVTAGYNMQMTNPAWEIKPAVLLKSEGVTASMDVNLTVVYNKKFWGGVSYRTASAVIGMVGIELMENLKVGYSYDFQTSSLMNYSTGSHELMVSYCFKLGVEKPPQKYRSIRYL